MRFLIGNGNAINPLHDPWLPTHPPRAPTLLAGVVPNIQTVRDLLLDITKQWNRPLLETLFVADDVREILQIRVSTREVPDLLGWSYTDSGLYTVKSGYWLATHLPDQVFVEPPAGSRVFKKAIWKLRTAPKLRFFLWRLLSNALATGTNLVHRGIITYAQCRRCCLDVETVEHLFFDCPFVQSIWRGTQIPNGVFFNPNCSFEEKFQAILEYSNNVSLSPLMRQIPLWTLWRIWKSRNLLVYQKRNNNWQQVLQYIFSDAAEWIHCCYRDASDTAIQNSSRQRKSSWKRPIREHVKCNYDCGFRGPALPTKSAWIIRDSYGFYCGAGQCMSSPCSSVLEAELQSLLIAMQQAWIKGYKKIVFEGDNKNVCKLVKGEVLNFPLHNLIRQIQTWQEKFVSADVVWVGRDSNQVADALVKKVNLDSSFVFHFYVPFDIVTFLYEDHSVSGS